MTEVRVWSVDATPSAPALPALHATLTADERCAVDRLHRVDDRARSIAARGALRCLVGSYLEEAPARVPILVAPGGKPYLADSDVRFNVAHSGRFALVALAWGSDVGVDLEFRRPGTEVLEVADRFLSDAEWTALACLAPHARARLAYACWTRKEAYLKCLGVGLTVPLDSFAVIESRRGEHAATRFVDTVSGVTIRGLDVGAGYDAAVAVRGSLAGDALVVVQLRITP